ncbi:hypothetical protein F5B17DRAFT_432900 [Nemania serpens]|nr:hypothetical protein F5B17DRAFT_432900 [Nemania serpens]
MKQDNAIPIIFTVIIIGLFIAFCVYMCRFHNSYNDSDSDGLSISYSSSLPSLSQISAYISDAAELLLRRPPRVHVPRGEPRGPQARAVPVDPRPGNGDGMA